MKPSHLDHHALDLPVARPRPPVVPLPHGHERLRLAVLGGPDQDDALATDVRAGLLAPQKTLPPKYFYDDHGSALFDRICDLPEYYLSRTGFALLQSIAADLIALTRPATIIELGSGASRSTRVLLDALDAARRPVTYVPFDVSAGMLVRTALDLLATYPSLHVHALVGDYERDLERLPAGDSRLVLFLGSTIGNLDPGATVSFLTGIRRQLVAGEHVLIGFDLVKPVPVLEAAYNDAAGVTAEFNRNVLRVLNTRLDADFDPDAFDHVAFFNPAASQIEMHLRARSGHTVAIRGLDLAVPFRAGETIHTEISRKFTHAEVQTTLEGCGYTLTRWYVSPDGFFALAVGTAVERAAIPSPPALPA